MTLKEALERKVVIHVLFLNNIAKRIPKSEWNNYLNCEVELAQEDDYDDETGLNYGFIWGIVIDVSIK